MARRKRSTRPPTAPPPGVPAPPGATIARRKPTVPQTARADESPAYSKASAKSLSEQYRHVKRDLVRIVVLSVLMFTLIFASKLIPLS